jgi:hypothetical protein
MLCGENTVKASIGQLTTMDDRGSVLERRTVVPSDARHFTSSTIAQCFPWGDGIAIIGGATEGQQIAPWLMRLDKAGSKQWEMLLGDLATHYPIELADHSLVLSRFGGSSLIELVRINQKGETQAKRAINAYGYLMLRSIEPTNRIRMIGFGIGNKGTLYTLNEKLEDAEMPKSIAAFDAEKGCGYFLPDKSLALFGRTDNAAIAWISESGQTNSLLVFDGKSFVVEDALPTVSNQFVSVRIGVSPNEYRGLILSWVTFK